VVSILHPFSCANLSIASTIDVGGGSVKNGTKYSLARIPLRWMIRECFRTKAGILFEADKLRAIGLDPESIVNPRPPPLPVNGQKILSIKEAEAEKSNDDGGTEEEEELRDALSPAYDQLSIQKLWWILEYLPLPERILLDCQRWKYRYRFVVTLIIVYPFY